MKKTTKKKSKTLPRRKRVNLEVGIVKAEAGGYRVEISRITKKKELRPIIHSVWKRTKKEAQKIYKQWTRGSRR